MSITKAPIFKIVRTEDPSFTFTIDNISKEYVTALRRTLLTKHSAFAVYAVDIYENTSNTIDEILTDHLKNVPFLSENKQDFPDCGTCNHDINSSTKVENETICNKCSLSCFVINVKHPKDAADETRIVTQLDIVENHLSSSLSDSFTEKVVEVESCGIKPWIFPSFPLPITTLYRGQQCHVRLWLTRRQAFHHKMFNPVDKVIARQNGAKITVRPSKQKDWSDYEKSEFVSKACPKKVFDIEDIVGSDKMTQTQIKVSRPQDCNLCMQCIHYSDVILKKPDTIIVETRPRNWYMEIKHHETMSAETIMKNTFKIIKEDVLDLMQHTKNPIIMPV